MKWANFKKKFKHSGSIKKPEALRVWTTIYFGERGSGKTLHQSKEMMNVLRYLRALYARRPDLNKAIVFTNQHVSQKVRDEYQDLLHYWREIEDIHYCPRKDCWRGKKRHPLHGALLIFDDVSIILDPRNWINVPAWLHKYFFLGRHFSIHILASLVDPNAVDINFRRCVEIGYQFTKIFGNPDPDETQPAIKRIFGIYRRRKVEAKVLWRQGNLPEQTIRLMLAQREELEKELKEQGRSMDIVEDNSWRGSYHLFNRTGKLWPFGYIFNPIASTEIYDTLQNVEEFKPKGLMCEEIYCIAPLHIHPWSKEFLNATPEQQKEMKKDTRYCDKIKRIYEVV